MLKNKKIAILSVTNDLTADQRVHKVALSLIKCDYAPLLIGIKKKESLQLKSRAYNTFRFSLFFKKGPLFYAEYNIRLFLLLLIKKQYLLVSNDLDSLLANFMVYKLKSAFTKIKLVYDSHEYFTEVPELNNRFAKKAWLLLEKMILPQIKHSYTVCKSIADEYNSLYNINMQVVRNIPLCNNHKQKSIETNPFLDKFNDEKIILYQGALNIGRGIEFVIKAMKHINNAIFVIIGDGDIYNELKQIVIDNKVDEKVFFTGKLPFNNLSKYTKNADLGIVLQEDISLSYKYVLPNRLFDYINAELPVIASDLPEIRKIISEYKTGILISDMNPEILAKEINDLLSNQKKYQEIKTNLKIIKNTFCWEKEETLLIKMFSELY